MKSLDIYGDAGIDSRVVCAVNDAEEKIKDSFLRIDRIAEANQIKVLTAMQQEQVSEACLVETTGYGYNDLGRDTLERVYARVFRTDEALVRSQIVCGTHALYIAAAGNTRPGGQIYSPVGLPYDTFQTVLGLNGANGSLKDYGVGFSYSELNEYGKPDYDRIRKEIPDNVSLIEIQRSRGYSQRDTFTLDEIGELIEYVKKLRPRAKVMVDNCYGEFVELMEPTEVGADMAVGSLIKNPGGGIAPVGGYIAGSEECVENAAARLTAPGLCRELGPSLGNNRPLFMGLFMAPSVTASAEKGAVLLAKVFEGLGFETSPASDSVRSDIIEAVSLKNADNLISFCKGIQKAAPVDSMFAPEPDAMPGYDCDIIMAAGCFTGGSSIELSADGPLREPYSVFYQGGLTYPHAKYGVMRAVQQLLDDGRIIL